MGSIKPSLQGTTSAKQTERKMHLLALTTSACLLVKMSEAAVAVGVGRLNPLWVSPSRGPLLSELHGLEPALPLLLPEKHLPGQAGRPHQPHRHRRLRG